MPGTIEGDSPKRDKLSGSKWFHTGLNWRATPEVGESRFRLCQTVVYTVSNKKYFIITYVSSKNLSFFLLECFSTEFPLYFLTKLKECQYKEVGLY